MARSKNDEILIDIGFNSDIDNFVKAIETKLKNADFGKLENISQGLKDINTNIDNLNNKKIDIKYEDPEDLDEILADLLNLQNTLNDGIKLDIGSGTARDKFKRFAGELIAEKQQLDKAMNNGILTIDDDYQVDNLTEYTKLLYNMLDVIKAIQERSKEKLLPGDLDIFNGKTNKSQKDIFGENIVDISTLQNNIEKELDKVKQIVNSEVHDVLSVSDNESGIPLYLKISTSKEVLIEQARQVITALKQYAKNNPIPIKLDLSSTIQSKTTTKQIKELERLLPNANDPEIKTQIEQLKNEISKNLTEGWSLRINTGELKEDTNLAKKAIIELEKAINDANDKLVLRPRIDIADETSKQLHDKLIKLNQLLDTDTKKAVDKVSKNLKKIGGGETQEFENNLENIITRFQDLANSTDSLNSLKAVFEGMASFVQTFSGKQFLNEELIKNLKGFKNAINITSKNGLGTQLELLNSNTAETETLSKALNTIVANLNTLKFDDVNLGVTDKDITLLINYTNALVGFLTSFEKIEKGLENGQLSGKLKQFVTTINDAFKDLDQDKLSPLKLLKFDDDDGNTGFDGALSELETFISKVEEARTQYNSAKKNLDNNKIKTATESVVDISKDITKLNTTAKANGVISVLNDVLKRGGELDKLIKLFNSPFGKSVNAPLELPKINTQKAAKSLEDNIYKDGGKLKGLYDKYVKNNDVANLEAFYRELEKISNEYFDLRKAKRDGFIDENSFKAASAYITAIIQELEQISGFQFPKLKTKRMDLLGMSDNKNEFAKFIADSKEFEAIEKEVFTSLDKEANTTLKNFDKVYSTVSKNISSLFNNNDDISPLVENIKDLYEQFQKLSQLHNLGIINDEEFEKVKNDLLYIGESVDKNFVRKVDGLNLDSDALNKYDENIADVYEHVQQLVTLLSTGASTNEIAKELYEINEASKSINTQRTQDYNDAAELKAMTDEAKELRDIIKSTKDKQLNFFNKQDVVSMHEFVEEYQNLISAYNIFQNNEENLTNAIGKENVDKIKAEFDGLFKDLNNGFLQFINKIKKLPIGETLKAELTEVLLNNPFDTTDKNIDKWANDVSVQLETLGNSLNVQGNKLSFNKILGKIYNDLNKNSNATKEWKTQMRALASEMESIGADNSSTLATKAFAERHQILDTQLKQSGQIGKDFFHKLSDNMQHQTTQLIAMTFSFYRLIGAIRQGFQTVTEFDSALAKISYTMDVSDKSLSNMGDTIIKLSKDLSTSITSMEQVYTIYANMNTSPEEIEELSKYTAVLSNLSGIDASTAADDIQAVVNQFENLNSTDTSHIVDVFDYISRNISVDYQKGIEGMAEGVQAVGNVADQAGLSYEQLSAIIAKTMEQTRNSGSSIANGLKTIMVRLSKASSMDDEVDNSTLSKASAVLHDIGVEVYTTEGQFREFDTIMTELAGKWDSLTEAQQANISFQIAATRQTAVLKAILQNWTESMDLATSATETNGNALENQEKYADTYAAKMQNIKNSLTELSITAFDDTGFKTMLDWVNKLAQAFTKLVDTIGTVPTAIAGIGAIVAKKFVGISDITDLYRNVAFNGKGKKELPNLLNSLSGQLGNSEKLNELTNTLTNYNERIVATSIANSKLSASEKELIATEMARKNTLINLDTLQLQDILSETKLEDTQKTEIMTALGLEAAINKLTDAEARKILVTKGLNEVEAESVVAKMKAVSAGAGGATSSFSNFLAGINPVIIALTALATILPIVKAAYDKYHISQQEYREDLSEKISDFKNAKNELEDLSEQLQTNKDKIRALQIQANQGKLSIVDKEELERLKEENIELEKNKGLKEAITQTAAIEAFEAAQKNPSDGYSGYKYTKPEEKSVEDVATKLSKQMETINNFRGSLQPYIESIKGLSVVEAKAALEMSQLDKQTQDQVLSSYKLQYANELTSDSFTKLEHSISKVNDFDTLGEAAKSTANAFKEAKKEYDTLRGEDVDEELYKKGEAKVNELQKQVDQQLQDLQQKISAYENYRDQGNILLPAAVEELKSYQSEFNNLAKTMFETTSADAYYEMMSSEDKLAMFREGIVARVAEAYDVEASFIDQELNEIFEKVAEKNGEIPKDFDFSKITYSGKEATTVNLANGLQFTFDTTDVSEENKKNIDEYVQNLYEDVIKSLQYQGKELSFSNILTEMILSNGIGLKSVDGLVGEIKQKVDDAINKEIEPKKTYKSFNDAWKALGDGDDEDASSKLKDNLTKLADEGLLTKKFFTEDDSIEKWAHKFGVSTEEASKDINSFIKWTDSMGLSVDGVLNKINNLSKDESRLKSLKDAVTKLQNAYSEKRDAVITNKDSTKQKEKLNTTEAASANTIADMEADFGDLKSWKKYKQVIGSTTSTLKECQEAQDELLTEYYNSGKFINEVVTATGKVDEATRSYYIAQLDELGVANAQEVVDEEILQRQVELKLSKIDLTTATEEEWKETLQEIDSLDALGVSADTAVEMIQALEVAKLTAGHETLKNSDDIDFLDDLILKCRDAGIEIQGLLDAKHYFSEAAKLAKIGGGSAGTADWLNSEGADAYEEWYKGYQKELETKNKELEIKEPNKDSSIENKKSSGETKRKTKEYIDWIARYIEEIQQKIDMQEAKLANTFTEKGQNKIYNSIINYYGKIAKAYKVASKKYTDSYKAFLNSKDGKKYITKAIRKKIENGTISGSRSQLIQMFGEERGKVINEAIERWKKSEQASVNAEKAITDKRNKKAEKYQKQADRRQAKSDYKRQLSEAEEKGYKYQNEKLKESYDLERASLKKQIKVAKINHDITEQKKLQAQLAQLDNSLAKEQFDNIIARYDRIKGAIEDRKAMTQSQIDLTTAKGANASTNYYRSIQQSDKELMAKNRKELAALQEQVKKTTKNSQERRDCEKQINDLLVEQNNLAADITQQNKNILDTYNKYVDAVRSGNNRIADELNFLDGLADYDKHTSDDIKGFFTDAGKAALDAAYKGFLISQRNVQFDKENYEKFFKAYNDPAIKAALDAGKTIDIITAQGEKVTINSFEQLRSEADKYSDNLKADIKAVYDYRNKTFELEKEKYTEELNLVKKLIDAKKKELDAEKDLHDYQRTISEKTTNITNLERQLAAYSGNTSEEGRAKLQSLQKQLSDAQKDLEETEYDRYISDQKNMLDELQTEYEEQINKYLEDFKARVDEGFKDAIANIKDGNEYLKALAKEHGYEPQYDDLGFIKELTKTINKLDSNIESESGLNGKGGSSKTNNTSTKEDLSPRQSFVMEKVPSSSTITNRLQTVAMAEDKKAKKELLNKIKDIVSNPKNQKKDTKNISDVNKLIYKKYKKALTTNGLKTLANVLGVPYGKDKDSVLYKALKEIGFAKGGIAKLIKRNGDDGIATLKRGEAVLTPLQSKQFAVLAKNLEHINSLMYEYQLANAKYEALMDLQQAQMEHQIAMQKVLTGHDKSASFDGDVNFYFELHDVQNPQMFLQQIKNDYKIQKALQEVTIKQLIEPNKLGVKKIK